MLPGFVELIPSVSHRHISVLHSGMIINIEKSTTDLDLARDRQRRRKTENNNRWKEQGSNLHCLTETRPGT